MPTNPLQKLLGFLAELEGRRIFHRLSRVRPEALRVEIAIPGERWEVEFFADGHVEVERFRTPGEVEDGPKAQASLDELLLEDSE